MYDQPKNEIRKIFTIHKNLYMRYLIFHNQTIILLFTGKQIHIL